MSTTSPFFKRPSRWHSARATGMVAVDVLRTGPRDDDLFPFDAQALGHGGHDAQVGLVRDQPITSPSRRHPGVGENPPGDLFHAGTAILKTLLPCI